MNRKILLTLIFALVCLVSAGAIHASDVNMTDSAQQIGDDTSLPISDASSDSVSESIDSNNLSTDDADIPVKENSKNQTEITPSGSSVYYKGEFDVVLKDSDGNVVVANRTINFIINNVKYTAVTDSNGVAGVKLLLTPGKYTARAYFEGDDNYNASNNLTLTLQILPTIKADNIVKYYMGSTKYTATFYDSEGHALANRNVVITVNGKSYTKKTNSKGVVSMAIDLKPGTYKVVATDPITGYKLTTTYKILSTISGSNLKKVMGDSKKFTAKFYKKNGKVLANKYIKFKFRGQTYKVKTNSKGNAKLSIKYTGKGTYNIVCYNKDGLSKTFKVKIYKRASTKLTTKMYTFLKSDTKKVKVTLANSLGYAPTSGQLVKIKINGKTYYKFTNSKGAVKLKLPSLKKGVYAIKYKFVGSTHYKASSVKSKVLVLSTSNPKFTVKSTTSFGYGAGTPFKVAVTAGGVPLIQRTVTFTVDGKTYARTTDSNGIASLPISLNIGDYTVKYSIKKESKVNAKSASTPIKVKQRAQTKITWKSGTSFEDSGQIFKVFVSDANGKAVAGQTVKLTIKSKTYTATTSSDGIAKFKTSAPIGTYTVTVKFAGSNDYLASSASQSVTITKSTSKKGVNEKNAILDLAKYLKSSTNCQVGNSKIKSLVNSLTNGLTSEYDKAVAIFNYVRDYISYSFYYDTKYGALGTLNSGRGNCVDHSHLLVAMFRTAGLAARYVHGTCKFSSGSTYGHVWTQVLIGDTWICADATSTRNSLGEIANWNTKSFSLSGIYASLPF